jgi:acetyl esterase/lipase
MRARRPRFLGLVIAGVIAVSAGAAGAAPPERGGGGREQRVCRERPEVVRDVEYDRIEGVEPNLLSLDLHLPATDEACSPVPVVIGVHGGGWVGGDKRGFTGDKAALFEEQGWAFANLNYRLSRRAQDPPVRYPMHNEDVARAVAWLFEHAEDYGIDTERVAILGHSAGAQIVASIVTDERYLEDVGLELRDVKCAFPDDTEGFDVAARVASGHRGARLYAAIFGTDPAVQREASPITHVEPDKDIPPMLLVQRGAAPRVAQLERFAEALRSADVEVDVIDATGYSHGDVNRLIGSTDDPIMTEPVTDFFADCFR